MSRQRKQTLSVRECTEPWVMSTSHGGDRHERSHDPFLAGIESRGSSPSPLGLTLSPQVSAGGPLDLTAEELEDGPLSSFMDVLGDDPWDLAALEGSPAEIFQYLPYTSTPKRDNTTAPATTTNLLVTQQYTTTPNKLMNTVADSGLQMSECLSFTPSTSSSRKRSRPSERERSPNLSWSSTSGTNKPCSVLLDITGDNSLYRRAGGDSFVNIADADSSCIERGSENCRENDRGKRVSIIRRNLAASKRTNIFEREFSAGTPHRYSQLERKKVCYYTGVEDWDAAAALLTRFAIKKHDHLSADRVVLMTLMRLRLHLEWKDLAFRFDTTEDAVVRLFKEALEIMAASLKDELSWSCEPSMRHRPPHRQPRLVYVHPVTFMSEHGLMKIFVAITGGRKPVLYVSNAHPADADPVRALTREMANRLISGDLISSKDTSDEHQHTNINTQQQQESVSCWRVERGGLRQVHLQTPAALTPVWETIKRLKQFKMFSGRFTATESVTKDIVTVVAALVNIDTSAPTVPAIRHQEFDQLRL